MASTGHLLVVDVSVGVGSRLELARVAARKSLEEMAAAAGISVRSYQRTIAGTRPPRRGELLAWAELTDQELEFFSAASPDDVGGGVLHDSAVSVKRSAA